MRRALACLVALIATAAANAAPITFDDLNTRNNFFSLGIANSYQGFKWGYSLSPGLGSAIIPANSANGWAVGTVANPAWSPAPTPVSGNTYAWNWNGTQSLIVDFGTPHDVAGAHFATLSSTYGFNASTVQLFGYDAAGNLLATSGLLNLTNSFQLLNANFKGVSKLEIRANANSSWFSVDNLNVTPAAVPEPFSIIVFGGVLAAGGLAVRRRMKVTA